MFDPYPHYMDSIWLLYFSIFFPKFRVQRALQAHSCHICWCHYRSFSAWTISREMCAELSARGQGTVAIMCVCVLAACYFKIPFDRLVLSPPSLPLYRVGIWPNLQKPRTLGFPLLTQLDHDDRCYPLLLILEILFFSKSIRCFRF